MTGVGFGRHVFGAAAFAFGLITLAWHDFRVWDELRYFLNAANGPEFVYAIASAQIVGGMSVQFRRTEKLGAVLLGAAYLTFAFLYVPRIVAAPRLYDRWGNFFEQFSLVTGGALLFARASSPGPSDLVNRIGRVALGTCVASFALEQAIYLDATATLVPAWLPPGQLFWAIATTVAFALAAVALLTNRSAWLASRLLTIMIAGFGVIVWLPLLWSGPHEYANWSETVETFAIAGTAWILTDLLGERAGADLARRTK